MKWWNSLHPVTQSALVLGFYILCFMVVLPS